MFPSLPTGAALLLLSAVLLPACAQVPQPEANLARPTGPDKAIKWRRLAWAHERSRVSGAAIERGRKEREQNLAWAFEQGEGTVASSET